MKPASIAFDLVPALGSFVISRLPPEYSFCPWFVRSAHNMACRVHFFVLPVIRISSAFVCSSPTMLLTIFFHSSLCNFYTFLWSSLIRWQVSYPFIVTGKGTLTAQFSQWKTAVHNVAMVFNSPIFVFLVGSLCLFQEYVFLYSLHYFIAYHELLSYSGSISDFLLNSSIISYFFFFYSARLDWPWCHLQTLGCHFIRLKGCFHFL